MASRGTPSLPKLVYTGTSGNIFTLIPSTGQVRQLTWSWEEKTETSGAQGSSARLTHVWPTWSPDGTRIACFGLRGTTGSAFSTSVYAVAADGIESWELAELAGGMPIYGNWSPQGDVFAALVQRGEQNLSLEIIMPAHPGTLLPLVKGAPLFWSWSPRGDRIAVHVKGSRRASADARVLVFDVASGRMIREVSTSPGEFRVPAWSPQDDLLVYVEQEATGGDTLFLYDVATGEKGPVAAIDGQAVALWSADGQALAFGDTVEPEALIFSSVKLLDLVAGRITSLLDEPILGFFWSPRGDALLYLSVDVHRSHLRWHRFTRTTGETVELVRFLPSREQTFIFSFFDQYALSHPPLAPDGSALAFAGHLVGPDALDATTPSQIYLLPLDRPTAPSPVASGQFVCWNL